MYKKRFEVLKAVKMPIAVCGVIWILKMVPDVSEERITPSSGLDSGGYRRFRETYPHARLRFVPCKITIYDTTILSFL
jgi:hypothetical protein